MTNYSRRVAAVFAAATLLTAVAACSSSGGTTPSSSPVGTSSSTPTESAKGDGSFPVTVHAANGPVTIAARPHAIVSLSPTATETLFTIGAGAQVKAVDKDSDYPAAAPHSKLDAYHINIEAIAGYQPDLVVASNVTPAQLAQFREVHLPVLDEPAAATLQQAYQEISQLGVATGHSAGAAATVNRMKRQISTIVASVPKRPATYYYELDPTFYSVTSATFIGRVLHLLGLTSIADSAKGAAAAGGYPQLTEEFIFNANPDYVFLADTVCCKQSASTVAKRPGWSALAAVRNSRVIALNDDIASRWGPRVVDLLRTVADGMRRHSRQ
jgi:iron complex transport system substrate-binding protein